MTTKRGEKKMTGAAAETRQQREGTKGGISGMGLLKWKCKWEVFEEEAGDASLQTKHLQREEERGRAVVGSTKRRQVMSEWEGRVGVWLWGGGRVGREEVAEWKFQQERGWQREGQGGLCTLSGGQSKPAQWSHQIPPSCPPLRLP